MELLGYGQFLLAAVVLADIEIPLVQALAVAVVVA
jgi:hypothetical protein